jgi:L-lactate dehydrogenase complex protein LldF
MGPIGSVLTPRLRGLDEFQHLSYASSLCGACSDVCPVKINLHHHLLHNRRDAVNASDRPWTERMGFAVWRWTVGDARRFSAAGWLARLGMRVLRSLRLDGTLLDPARAWNKNHAAPLAPEKSFRGLWGKQNGHN